MKRAQLAIVLTICLNAGCALLYPPRDVIGVNPEPRQPSKERIAELAAVSVDTKYKEAPFALSFYPQVTLPGGSVRVTCHVPPSWGAEAIAVKGFQGKLAYMTPMYLYEPRVVEGVICGQNETVCRVMLPSGHVKEISNVMEVPCPEDR